jgi:hypothetical protein
LEALVNWLLETLQQQMRTYALQSLESVLLGLALGAVVHALRLPTRALDTQHFNLFLIAEFTAALSTQRLTHQTSLQTVVSRGQQTQ